MRKFRYFTEAEKAKIVENLTDADRAEIAINLVGFLQVRQNAIDILHKHMEYVASSNNEELKQMLPCLEHGLGVIEAGKARVIRDGIEGTAIDLAYSVRGGRPGLGLTRGFGEFLYNFKDQGFKKEWADEIYDAAGAIEDYYNNM